MKNQLIYIFFVLIFLVTFPTLTIFLLCALAGITMIYAGFKAIKNRKNHLGYKKNYIHGRIVIKTLEGDEAVMLGCVS